MYLCMKTMKWVTMNFAALFYEQKEAGGVCETEYMSLATPNSWIHQQFISIHSKIMIIIKLEVIISVSSMYIDDA